MFTFALGFVTGETPRFDLPSILADRERLFSFFEARVKQAANTTFGKNKVRVRIRKMFFDL